MSEPPSFSIELDTIDDARTMSQAGLNDSPIAAIRLLDQERCLFASEAPAAPRVAVAPDGPTSPLDRSGDRNPSPACESRSAVGAALPLGDLTGSGRWVSDADYHRCHDALTGLINRVEMVLRLNKAVKTSRQTGKMHAFLQIDLDEFRLINHIFGYRAGDRVLRQVGNLLRCCVGPDDTVARLDGDQYGMLLEDCDAQRAQRVAAGICERIERVRFLYEDKNLRVSASIGVVAFGCTLSDEEILQAADISCQAAKESGRNRVRFWSRSDRAISARYDETFWAGRIEQALDENRFELYGQRIEGIGETIGGMHCEVLLRLRGTDGKLFLPGAFLSAAEHYHIITRIDRWVVSHVFDWMARVRDAAAADRVQMVSINLSGQSIDDQRFQRDLLDMLRNAAFDIRKLCFEITETAAIVHLDAAKLFAAALRELGIKIALDDFGAGMSSFSYLRAMPVDYLKIDGQFIANALNDDLNLAAIRCFCDVARVVGVKTIAEFVENEEIRRTLGTLGVNLAQGYLIHRPEPLLGLIGRA
jgi:diguanylate cyclase (GGDEF)-like protein